MLNSRVARIEGPLQRVANRTGLPDGLKAGVEALSGLSMDGVKVHYNSSQPAQLNAHAYAQGTDIHIAPGQEKHLPHEAWHVVQQAQGRVKPTKQLKGRVSVNDDKGLEHEADMMGARAATGTVPARASLIQAAGPTAPVAQGRLYFGTLAVTPEQKDELKDRARNKSPALEAKLEMYSADDRDWDVDIRGSLTGHHGFTVEGFKEIVRRPTIPGMGNLTLAPVKSKLGWTFHGRPGWTKEVVAAVKTKPHLENIRHVIPYHLIRTKFMGYLNSLFVPEPGAGAVIAGDVVPVLQQLALAVGADDAGEHDDDADVVIELAVNILARLNSVPGNLWAGSATENQRLNSLRVRLDSLIERIPADTINQLDIIDALHKSRDDAKSNIYRELIQGVIAHLPRIGDPNYGNRLVWIERLKLASLSAEADVFPSKGELEKMHNKGEQMVSNMPVLMEIFQTFAAGNFPDAAIRLAELPSPHAPVLPPPHAPDSMDTD